MFSGRIQKYISDYISRHRNSQSPFKLGLRSAFQRHLYQPPDKRLERIFRLKKAGRLHEYHLELRDAAIEFARHGLAGEAVKTAALLPAEYVNSHLASCLNIVQNSDGKHFSYISLEVSTVCNLRCPLCVQDSAWDRDYPNLGRLMPFDDFKTIWDKLKGKCQGLCLTGKGESFLHPDIYKMLDYASDVPISLDTNGNAPFDAEKLVGRNMHLVFSVDGIDQRTYEKYRVGGNFEKAVANIDKLIKLKKARKSALPTVTFKFIVFKHNEMYLEQARQLAASLEVDHFRADICQIPSPLSEARVKSFYPLVYQSADKVESFDLDTTIPFFCDDHNSPYCCQPLTAPYITVDGSLTPCCIATEFFRDINLLHKSLDECWFDPHFVAFRHEAMTDKNQHHICRTCCGGTRHTPYYQKSFDHTPLAYPELPPLSSNLIHTADLMIDESEAANFLPEELEYFRCAGKYLGLSR